MVHIKDSPTLARTHARAHTRMHAHTRTHQDVESLVLAEKLRDFEGDLVEAEQHDVPAAYSMIKALLNAIGLFHTAL